MATRIPLSLAEKERLYAEKVRGRSLAAIATELGCSFETARKWWRVARDHGRSAFQQTRRGRAPSGVLSRFAPVLISRALAFKRDHPTWGPTVYWPNCNPTRCSPASACPAARVWRCCSRLVALNWLRYAARVAHLHLRHLALVRCTSAGNSIFRRPFRLPKTIAPVLQPSVTRSAPRLWPVERLMSPLAHAVVASAGRKCVGCCVAHSRSGKRCLIASKPIMRSAWVGNPVIHGPAC